MSQADKTVTVGIWLLPRFSLLAHASVVEPLLACNRISGELLYQLNMLGLEKCVASDSGVSIKTTALSELKTGLDMLIVCGGSPANYVDSPELLNQLKSLPKNCSRLCGVASGGYALARAGLLNHRKASVHWYSLASLRADYPEVRFATDLFSMDGRYATCRGATAALDMMSMLIAQDQGSELLDALAQYFVRERLGVAGDSYERQMLSESARAEQPKLAEAIELMQANIEEPLSTDDLAQHVELSRRQLERLFNKYLDSVPSRYYLQIRLEQARHLLRESADSLSQIALRTGFKTSAHFSTAYRNLYGLTPSEERSLSV